MINGYVSPNPAGAVVVAKNSTREEAPTQSVHWGRGALKTGRCVWKAGLRQGERKAA